MDPDNERFAQWVARHLPDRVKYWVFIQLGVKHLGEGNEVVTEVPYVTVLNRLAR